MQTKGFTLVEMIISLSIMAMITTIALPIVNQHRPPEVIISEMLHRQSLALITNAPQDVLINGVKQFHYNNRGNVSSALSFDYDQYEIIVRLGYGNIRYE